MHRFIYDDDQIELIRALKNRQFSHIYHDDAYQFTFDFSTEHITAWPGENSAATQNQYDEAITVSFKLNSEPYHPSQHDRCLFSNSVIDKIWIARTVLYFTAFKPLHPEQEKSLVSSQEWSGSTDLDRTIRNLIQASSGSYEEIVVHPDSDYVCSSISDEYMNLVDAGILVQVESSYLSCFSRNNGFIIRTTIQSQKEMSADEDILNYDFIEV